MRPFRLIALWGVLATHVAAADDARLGAALQGALQQSPAGTPQTVWVFFRDKGVAAESRLAEARAHVTPRALARRALRGRPGIDMRDVPPLPAYAAAVTRTVLRVRQSSRWFNALSVEATPEQIAALARLPFVETVDLVRRFRPRGETPGVATQALHDAPRAAPAPGLDYGTSIGQVAMINVPALHERGLHGEGVVVAVLDGGVDALYHEVFATLQLVAQRDFVNGDGDVGNGGQGEGSHGTETLSALAAFKPGELIGPAFAAGFLLAKTENSDSETPVEEDNWAAAAEWAEGLGADVISSSLGYLGFDPPYPGYDWTAMNGQVAISTRAAELATTRGVVVVVAAGNEGFNPVHNTLGAPADAVHVIATASVDPARTRSSFSSVGPTVDGRIKPDVAAQGGGVKVAAPGSADRYRIINGTSFSCPLTAGVVALLLQAHPTYTVDQVLAVLRATSSQAAAPDNLLGWGIIDGLAAVQAVPPAPAQ